MKFYLSVFCLINVITVVESSVKLDIKPSTNIPAGAANLTVRCQPITSAFVNSVNRLAIYRRLAGVSTEQVLGTIQVGKQPALGTGLTSPKYTVTGSLTAIGAFSTSFLQIVILEPNSRDKGIYGCNLTGTHNGGGSSYINDILTVNVQGSGDMNAGSVVFFLSASFISLILY